MDGNKLSIRIIYNNGLGDETDITKTLSSPDIVSVYQAIREALMGFGFQQATVDEWLPPQ